MIGLKAHIHAYEICLTRSLQVADQTINRRKIVGVTLTDETGQAASASSGQAGYGEVSPLPGLHRETFDQAMTQLQAVVDRINQTSRLPALDALYPSVRWGVDMAVRDKARSPMPKQAIKLNGLIWNDGMDHIDYLLDQGYSCLKLKVGRDDIDGDIHRVKTIRDHVQDRAVLRLDANRRWSLDQALRFGRAIGPEGIAYVEEPTINPADQDQFYSETGIPFAWDESLLEGKLHTHSGLTALVIKPAVTGTLESVDRLVAWAKDHGKQAVISSVFESCQCLAFYAQYCVDKDLTEIHHGLDTWRWLKDDPCLSNMVLQQGSLVI